MPVWSRARTLRARLGLIAVDAAGTAVGFLAAGGVIYGGRLPGVVGASWIFLLAMAITVQVSIGDLVGLYRGRWRRCSFDEAMAIAAAVMTAIAVMLAIDVWLGTRVPPAAAVTGGVFTLVTIGAIRCVEQVSLDRRLRPSRNVCHRVVVLGAGNAGEQVVKAMLRNPDSEYFPVALLDDDPHKAGLRIMGVAVQGSRHDLAQVAETHRADTLLVAMPTAGALLVRQLAEDARRCRLAFKVLPPLSELPDGVVRLTDVRALTPRDMLGRREIEIDVDAVAGYLTGKRLLVTGAGGSIGSELCRQLARFAPERIVMLDRDESALHRVQLIVYGRALLDDRTVVVADIRDRARLDEVFDEHQPDVVFHTAALKHLPLLEMHPAEALKSNVWGTANVLEVAAGHGVERFVNISTDKAADPISVLGWSKRVGERLTASYGQSATGVYLSVRFGNVLGSRGSVLHAFQAQIESGGPLTLTHPDVTRYFMTVEEAVRLVIQAGVVGRPGEVLVLDMGVPVRIHDVARQLIAASGRDLEIVYTGLRQGEKLHEVLLGMTERDERPVHPLITHVSVPALDPEWLPDRSEPLSDLKSLVEMRRLSSLAPPAIATIAVEA